MQPTTILLPEYRAACIVSGFRRWRNPTTGKVLTVADAVWDRLCGAGHYPRVTDTCTMMRLADALSHLHELPVNAPRLYGKLGRRGPVGREQEYRPY
jgi:hypothetical protein